MNYCCSKTYFRFFTLFGHSNSNWHSCMGVLKWRGSIKGLKSVTYCLNAPFFLLKKLSTSCETSFKLYFLIRLSGQSSWALTTWHTDWTESDWQAENCGAESWRPELTWSLFFSSFSSPKGTRVRIGNANSVNWPIFATRKKMALKSLLK